jgi:hypothetical protein
MTLQAATELIGRLKQLLGRDAVLTPDEDIERYVQEPRGRYRGLSRWPSLALRPLSRLPPS